MTTPSSPSASSPSPPIAPAPPESTPVVVASPPGDRHRLSRTAARLIAGLLLLYFAIAYLGMPELWTVYVHRHPKFADVPGVTHTRNGMPGDPLNVVLIVDEDGLPDLMRSAGWYAADPLSIRDDVHIAEAAVLGRPYVAAPVSNLYLFGRREDAAFEQDVGNNPRVRHHVRFWKCPDPSEDGRPTWIGSAVFDEKVGLSRDTGQITHVTSPDVDVERDKLLHDLQATGRLSEVYYVPDFHIIRAGRNGGGDVWRTDGQLGVGVEKTTASLKTESTSAR